mgnify:CR=1 FL=1
MGMTKTFQWQQKNEKELMSETQDVMTMTRNWPAKGRAEDKYNFAEYSAFEVPEFE